MDISLKKIKSKKCKILQGIVYKTNLFKFFSQIIGRTPKRMVKMETSLEAAKWGRILRMMSWKMWFKWEGLSTQSDLMIDIMTNLVRVLLQTLRKGCGGTQGPSVAPSHVLTQREEQAWWLSKHHTLGPIWQNTDQIHDLVINRTERRIYAEFSSKLSEKVAEGLKGFP